MSDELIPLDDPNRCKRLTRNGQCEYRSLEGSDFCEGHGGALAAAKASRRQYQLDEVRRQQLDQFADNSAIYGLKEEIGLVRLSIQSFFKKYGDAEALLAYYPALNTMLLTLEKLMKTSVDLESKLGQTLSKDVVLSLVQMWCNITAEELKNAQVPDYEDIMDHITTRMTQSAIVAKDPD